MSRQKDTPQQRRPTTAVRAKALLAKQVARRPVAAVVGARMQKVVDELAGSRSAFARLLSVGTSHVTKWCDRGMLPGAKKLREIAERADVSVDWLLGFDVPRRRSDRAPVGELATALLTEVVRRYDARAMNARRDGLAHVLGGTLELQDPGVYEVGKDLSIVAGQWLQDGRLVLAEGIPGALLLSADPRTLLDRVGDWVIREALTWESNHEEEERAAVRKSVERLYRRLSRDERSPHLDRLIRAALRPLDPKSKAGLEAVHREVANKQWKEARRSVPEAEFEALLPDIDELLALEKDTTAPVPRRAQEKS